MTTFDQEILARTAVGEARGEGEDGMVAVMWSVINRFTSKRWFAGASIAGTCLMKAQYDCWSPSDPNYTVIANITDANGLFASALQWADGVISGMIPDPTLGATDYYDDSIQPPNWTAGATFAVKIGRLNFYKDVN